jgi:hypothetical protein
MKPREMLYKNYATHIELCSVWYSGTSTIHNTLLTPGTLRRTSTELNNITKQRARTFSAQYLASSSTLSVVER